MSDIDMYIVSKSNTYELYAEDRIGTTSHIQDTYEYAVHSFFLVS